MRERPSRLRAEFVYERVFNTTETFSVLAGVMWKVSDDLSFDVGVREAWGQSPTGD
jgi:hypothetical protein